MMAVNCVPKVTRYEANRSPRKPIPFAAAMISILKFRDRPIVINVERNLVHPCNLESLETTSVDPDPV
jgi:hypothetical protein